MTDRHLRLSKADSPDPAEPPAPIADAEEETVGLAVSRALQDLVDRFDGFIRRTASRHGLRGAELDDVVQDLRVRLWRSFGTAEMIRRANPTYVHRAAISASLDIVRRRRARPADRLDDVPPPVDQRASADARVDRSELGRQVHDALGMLSESRRGVVRLYLAGYDREDIADLLGWTEGKTRNLLYRGLDDLRRVLISRGITPEETR